MKQQPIRPFLVLYFKSYQSTYTEGNATSSGHCSTARNAVLACVRNILDRGYHHCEILLPGGVSLANVNKYRDGIRVNIVRSRALRRAA